MKPSTRNLQALPSIDKLKQVCRSIAMLDAILCPEWEYRYFSFQKNWSPNEQMASMRDGSGDHYYILFTSKGVVINGFCHESEMSPYGNNNQVWKGIHEKLPSELSAFLTEPAFETENTTFCIWRRYSDDAYQIGDVVFPENYPYGDGSEDILFALSGNPKDYIDWAIEYYELENGIDVETVNAIFNLQPLTVEFCKALNNEAEYKSVIADAQEIGYPIIVY